MVIKEDVRKGISTAISVRVEFSGAAIFSSHFVSPMFVTVKEHRDRFDCLTRIFEIQNEIQNQSN